MDMMSMSRISGSIHDDKESRDSFEDHRVLTMRYSERNTRRSKNNLCVRSEDRDDSYAVQDDAFGIKR